MKNLLTIGFILAMLCISCTDKKGAKNTAIPSDAEELQKMETQSNELKSIENDLSKNMDELDALLKEVDEN